MSARQHFNAGRAGVRGVTLVEAMVALLIMSFGMLALVGLQANLRRSADVAKQRGEATKIAQVTMEDTRAFGALETASAPTGVLAFDAIAASAVDSAGRADSNATFAMNRSVAASANPPMISVDVAVQWTDRASELQNVRLSTFIAAIDPGLSGSLMIPPPDGISSRRPQGRSTDIPPVAADVGGGRSVFKPDASGTVAWVFNNLSGEITSVCAGLSPSTQAADVDISGCTATKAYLLSGYVRYSTVSPPDSEQPNSAAMAFGLTLAVDVPVAEFPSPAYQCYSRFPSATVGSYYCAVFPRSSTGDAANRPVNTWGGRLDLTGISLGTYKICRYTADYDGNGSISNAEHPATYTKVAGALTRQNFLVIRASESCPAGHPASPDTGVFTNTATVLHQSAP